MKTRVFLILVLTALSNTLAHGQERDQSDVRIDVRQLELLGGAERRDIGCMPLLSGKHRVALSVLEINGNPFFGYSAREPGPNSRMPVEFRFAVMQLIAKHLPDWTPVDAYSEADIMLAITLYPVEQPPGSEVYLLNTSIHVLNSSIAPKDCRSWADRRYTSDVPAVLNQILKRAATGTVATP